MTKMIDVDAQKVYGYTYDARGNRIAETVNGNIQKQYEFSPMNRLEKVITETGLEKVYTYNGVGQRVGETTGDNQISYVLDMTKKFNNLLQRESNDNVESYTWAGRVLGRQTETSNEFFLQDELGSVTRFLDKEGDILATYGYDEFGNDLSVDIPYYAKQGAYQPFGYTGYRMDTESGLYFAQAREYSSAHGQFVSEDIVRGYVESPMTLNHYGYCWGNPVKLVDLDGRWPSWEDVADFWNKNIYGEETVVAEKPNVYTKGGNEIGVYWGEQKSYPKASDEYTGSIIKKTVTTGAENSVSYSINLPSKDLGNGNKVGIPISIGITIDGDGIDLAKSFGIDIGKFGISTSKDIGADLKEWISKNDGLDIRWGDNSYGLSISGGLSPFSRVKIEAHSSGSEGDFILNKFVGGYMNTALEYLLAISAVCTAGIMTGAIDPGVVLQYIEQLRMWMFENATCLVK